MGSTQKIPAPPKLPTVKLDTTLIDLYKQASPRHSNSRLGMVFGLVNSGIDLSPDIPRNAKYLYQDSPFIKVPRNELTKNNHQLQKDLSIRYLSLVPQRDAFISGHTPTVLFHRGPSTSQHDQSQAEQTFSVLDQSQQPEVIFCPGPSKLDIAIKQHNIQHMAYKIVSDEMATKYEKYLLHDPEAHWRMNSKAALIAPELPTPKTQILPIDGLPPRPSDCCGHCHSSRSATIKKGQIPHIPESCTGPRRSWLSTQIAKILGAIEDQDLPFVLKTQQTFGGAGTWVITTPEEKASLLSDLAGENGLLEKLLPQVTDQNAHLQPAAMLISEYVDKPVKNYGITFVVTAQDEKDGTSSRGRFLAASEQIVDPSSRAWLGSTIDYGRQDFLRSKFQGLIDQTAEWICKAGYFGPVGIDVLESKLPSGDASKFDIVDLNARPSGSLALPLLKTHFTSRSLNLATSLTISCRGGRADFFCSFYTEFEDGSMVILSWYEDHDHEGAEEEIRSFGDVVVGAQDQRALDALLERVRAGSKEVTF